MYIQSFVMLLLAYRGSSYAEPQSISKIDALRLEFLQLEETWWELIFDNFLVHDFFNPANRQEITLLTKFQVFGDRLQKAFPHDLKYGLEPVQNVDILLKAHTELRGVYALYESFRRFQKLQTAPGRIPSPKQEWLHLTNTLLQNGRWSIKHIQISISEIIKNHFYDEILKETARFKMCYKNKSDHQILYNVYNTVELTELKGYMMLQFSYMLLTLYKEGNYANETKSIRDLYKEHTLQSVVAIKKAMKKSSRELWKCDPHKHIPGTTYIEVTRLLQGYVVNQAYLNSDGHCWGYCNMYNYTKTHNCNETDWYYCNDSYRCNGTLLNCTAITSNLRVCPGDVTRRRFESIESDGNIFGRKSTCQRSKTHADTWSKGLGSECQFCFCFCDDKEDKYSDRYFSMQSVIADVENNKVVTGLRFTKVNRISHLQIQEGKLLPEGEVDQSSIQWVPVQDFKLTDRFVYSGQDYHTLTGEERNIDLDDVIVDDKHLLTGVRFKKIGVHLNFEVYMTPFDFKKGQLLDPIHRSVWKDNKYYQLKRTKVSLIKPDIPTRIINTSKPDSISGQYIEFTHTDKDKDAAQTTVPFLDAQPVVPELVVPLAGAGIYHKGRYNSGGFIAPKIITYDFSIHINGEFPKK